MARTARIFHDEGDGAKSWIPQPGDSYEITGIDSTGRRFFLQTSNWMHASGINVWQGSKWLKRNGHRFLIQRVTN
jgi:hypothetical protein